MSQFSKAVEKWLEGIGTEFGPHSRQCAEKTLMCLQSIGYELIPTRTGWGVGAKLKRGNRFVAPLEIYGFKSRGPVIEFNLSALGSAAARQKLGNEVKSWHAAGFQWQAENLNGYPSISLKALLNDQLFGRFEELAAGLRLQTLEPS